MLDILTLLACAEVTCDGVAPDFGDACLVVVATAVEGPEPDSAGVRFAFGDDGAEPDREGMWDSALAIWFTPADDVRVFAGTAETADVTQCAGVEYVDLDPFQTVELTVETTCGDPQP